MNEAYQRFFDFMQQEHGLTLLTTQMDDIVAEAVKLHDEIQQQEYNDNMATAIDVGGGCSRCGDLSGFECTCDDEEDDWDYCCEICLEFGSCRNTDDVQAYHDLYGDH